MTDSKRPKIEPGDVVQTYTDGDLHVTRDGWLLWQLRGSTEVTPVGVQPDSPAAKALRNEG